MTIRSGCPRLALFLAGCAAFLHLYATQGLLTELATEFAVSARQASWSVTLTTLAVALVAPFVGRLSGRLAQHRVVAFAALGLALPALMAACADSFSAFLGWRFLQGVLIPMVFVTSVAYIGVRWQGADVADLTSVYVAGTVLGGFCGRVLTGALTEYAGWRLALSVLAGVSLLTGLAIALWLPPNRRVPAPPRRARMASELFSRAMLAAYAVGFCILFAQVATFTYVGLHLSAAPYSLGVGALGAIYSVFLLALIVVPLAGRLSKTRPRSELVRAAAGLGVLGSLLALAPSLWVVIAGLALSSTSVFLAQAAANAFITAHAREHKASAVGLYLSCYYLGGSFGAFIPGLLWQRWGWSGCIALIMVVQALPLLIVRTNWKMPALPGRAALAVAGQVPLPASLQTSLDAHDSLAHKEKGK